MSRTSRTDAGKPQDAPAKTSAPLAKPEAGIPDCDGLEERIERLEKRLEETINGLEGSVPVRAPRAVDDSERDDPLRRAVERSNDKRETEK